MKVRVTARMPEILLACATLIPLIGCQGLKNSSPGSGSVNQLNHIVFMVQENRSFDTYFGKLPAYWQSHGFPSQAFDGLPADASNPSFDGLSTVSAFHLPTVCIQNVSAFWNEDHFDWNRNDPTSAMATMDGFVFTAAHYAQTAPANEAPIFDTEGHRAIGYYDGSDLNYYYFMASHFATSDRWFSPAMTRTQPNRLYLLAGTSFGLVYPPNTVFNPESAPMLVDKSNLEPHTDPFTQDNIFTLLDRANVSWKIYETDPGTAYIHYFEPYATQHAANIVPVSQYLTDVQNQTLPAVALIEGGYNSGRDEHPLNNIQTGAAYVESLINALMSSPSWKDSAFILTWDEAGGLYDHVPPPSAVSPDGIPPSDLQPGDVCQAGPSSGANCDFNHTGFRVPLLVVSPFTKKNFVSHTVADYTAILKLIETRFNLPSLTKRDAAQMDMSEFFDFDNPPWMTPPTPPAQNTNGVCDYHALP